MRISLSPWHKKGKNKQLKKHQYVWQCCIKSQNQYHSNKYKYVFGLGPNNSVSAAHKSHQNWRMMYFPDYFSPLVFWRYHRAGQPDQYELCSTVTHHVHTGCSGGCHPSPPDAAPQYLPGLHPQLTLSHLRSMERRHNSKTIHRFLRDFRCQSTCEATWSVN